MGESRVSYRGDESTKGKVLCIILDDGVLLFSKHTSRSHQDEAEWPLLTLLFYSM